MAPIARGISSAGSLEIAFSAPGNVFAETEATTVSGGKPFAAYELTDWLGKGVSSGSLSAEGRLVLKGLKAGYYHLRQGEEDVTFAVVPDTSTRVFDKNSFYGVD